MIVSDQHRFLFVHIPKCAGTSVRRALQPWDETGGTFSARIVDHPRLGRIDLTHLPLDLLCVVAPEIHARLSDPSYVAYAIVRDPYQRFPSALAQRVKMYRGVEMAQLDDAALRTEVDAVIGYLGREARVTSPEYIHFVRQIDFVEHGGRRLVGEIYPVERLEEFRAAISARIGTPLAAFGHENRADLMRFPALAGVLGRLGRLSRRLLPAGLAAQLRSAGRRRLMRPAQDRLPAVFRSEAVRSFVADYYAADIRMHGAALAGAPSGSEERTISA